MRAALLTSIFALSVSGCAYYPDLYSIDTSQLRARACANVSNIDPLSLQRLNENCSGDVKADPVSPPAVEVSYETEETRTTRRFVDTGEGADQVEEIEWLEKKSSPVIYETYSAATAQANVLTHLERAIVQASWLQDKYETNYREVSKIRDILELPVLVAAGAAGLVLVDGGFFEKGNQTSRASEIGVIALTYSAGKDALTSPSMAEYYIRGHGALNCAIAWSLPFTEVASDGPHRKFENSIAFQLKVINALESLNGVPSVDDPAADDATNQAAKQLLNSARTVSKTALSNARPARNTALAELSAFNSVATAFQLEVSEISVLVATKGQARTVANYSTISTSFGGAPDDAGGGDGEKSSDQLSILSNDGIMAPIAQDFSIDMSDVRSGTITHRDLALLTSAVIERLYTATSDLTGYNPGYAAAVTNLQACSGNVAIPVPAG